MPTVIGGCAPRACAGDCAPTGAGRCAPTRAGGCAPTRGGGGAPDGIGDRGEEIAPNRYTPLVSRAPVTPGSRFSAGRVGGRVAWRGSLWVTVCRAGSVVVACLRGCWSGCVQFIGGGVWGVSPGGVVCCGVGGVWLPLDGWRLVAVVACSGFRRTALHTHPTHGRTDSHGPPHQPPDGPPRCPPRPRLPTSSLTNSGKPSGRCCPHPARPTGPTSGPTYAPSSPEPCARKSSASPAATSRPHSEPTARPYAPACDAGRLTPPGQPSAASWTTPPTCGSSAPPYPGQPPDLTSEPGPQAPDLPFVTLGPCRRKPSVTKPERPRAAPRQETRTARGELRCGHIGTARPGSDGRASGWCSTHTEPSVGSVQHSPSGESSHTHWRSDSTVTP